MTKPLTEMTVSEAASKALAIILAGDFEVKQERYKTGGYEWYDPNAKWDDDLRAEYDLDKDDDLSNLDDIQGAWQEAKYNGGKYTRDGLTAERVAEYGGEGDGDQYWVVISLSDGLTTRHFRKDGWYASYDGGYLDGDTSEVKPVEKTVVFYE